MSVDFQENNFTNSHFQSREILGMPKTPKLITRLIRAGIVKDEQTAGKFLLALIVLSIIISIIIAISLLKPEEVRYNLSQEIIDTLPAEVQAKIYESKK